MNDATLLLSAMEQGDLTAADKLLELLYEELRRLTASKMARETPGQMDFQRDQELLENRLANSVQNGALFSGG